MCYSSWGHRVRLRLIYLKSKTLATRNAAKDAEQHELSFTAGGNAKWYSHFNFLCIYLFIGLHWILIVACMIFSCGMWDLVT